MDQVGRQLKEAQALQTEILRKSRDHETLNSEGHKLISTSDRDGDTVQAVLDSVNNRWTELSDGTSYLPILLFKSNHYYITLVMLQRPYSSLVCI